MATSGIGHQLKDIIDKTKRCQCSNCRMVSTNKLFVLAPELLAQLEQLRANIETLRNWKSPDGVLQVKDLGWFRDLKLENEV